jgi:hypothetical protein
MLPPESWLLMKKWVNFYVILLTKSIICSILDTMKTTGFEKLTHHAASLNTAITTPFTLGVRLTHSIRKAYDEYPYSSTGFPNLFMALLSDSVVIPTKSVGIPANFVGIPAKSVGVPANFVGIPAKFVGVPTKSVGIPAKSVGVPANFVGIPAKSVGVPAKSVGIPAKFVGITTNTLAASLRHQNRFSIFYI